MQIWVLIRMLMVIRHRGPVDLGVHVVLGNMLLPIVLRVVISELGRVTRISLEHLLLHSITSVHIG